MDIAWRRRQNGGGFLHEMALRTPRGGLRSSSAPLLSSVAGRQLDGTGFMGRELATARRAHYACMLVKAGDAANWTVGRTSSGFPQNRADQPAARYICKTRRSVLRDRTVYTAQLANSVIAWPTSAKHILPQADIEPLRRELPN